MYLSFDFPLGSSQARFWYQFEKFIHPANLFGKVLPLFAVSVTAVYLFREATKPRIKVIEHVDAWYNQK
jgi:hypothetical protein